LPNSSTSPAAVARSRFRPGAAGWALAGIVIAAAGLRFWNITQLPPGYWYDEAHKSIVALAIARGQLFPIYVTDNQGIEAGYFWLLAGWFRLFGPSFFGTRYLAALLGTATIPLTYWAVFTTYKEIPQRRLLALASAGWLAILLWHVLWSRLGFEVISVPLFAVALLGLMAWAWQRQRGWAFALAGAVLGLSLYTNPGARVLPLQALVTFAIFSAGPWRRRIALGLAFLAGAILIFAPLGIFFIRNPQWFVARASFTSTNTRAGGGLAYAGNLVKTLLSLNFQGDVLPRHNLALRPAFDPISSAWMFVGLLSLWRPASRTQSRVWRAHAAVISALTINLLPAVLNDGAPEFGRSLGATPFLVVLPALGVVLAAGLIPSRFGRAILAATVLAAAGWNAFDYFYRYPRQPGLFDSFEIGQWTLIQGALQASRNGTGYLLFDEPSLNHPTTQLAVQLGAGDLRLVNGQSCLAYPAVATTPVVLGTLEAERAALSERLPGASIQLVLHEPEIYPYGALFALPAGYVAPAEREQAVARLGDRVDLLSVPLPAGPVAPGSVLSVSLRWRVAQAIEGRYNVFVHLASADQPLLSGADGEPCGGWYPTNRWHAGEVIEHTLQLKIPSDLVPGRYFVAAGLYDWQTGARLPVVQTDQREPDRAFVGSIDVR
jgi:Dolichyl-phosphate-mannose-protein mannosyltransferase